MVGVEARLRGNGGVGIGAEFDPVAQVELAHSEPPAERGLIERARPLEERQVPRLVDGRPRAGHARTLPNRPNPRLRQDFRGAARGNPDANVGWARSTGVTGPVRRRGAWARTVGVHDDGIRVRAARRRGGDHDQPAGGAQRADLQTYDELEAAVRNTTARCLVITGADPAFCSGDDVKQMMGGGEQPPEPVVGRAPRSRPPPTRSCTPTCRWSPPSTAPPSAGGWSWR